jgi:hypothetical protein
MEYFTIEEMIKLNVGKHIVQGYMNLIYELYADALIESEKLRKDEQQNLIDY